MCMSIKSSGGRMDYKRYRKQSCQEMEFRPVVGFEKIKREPASIKNLRVKLNATEPTGVNTSTDRKRRLFEMSSEDEACEEQRERSLFASNHRNIRHQIPRRKSFSAYQSDESLHENSSISSSPSNGGLKSALKSNLNTSRTRSGRILRRSSNKQVSFDPASSAKSTSQKPRRRIRDPSPSSESSDSDIFVAVKVPSSERNIERKNRDI